MKIAILSIILILFVGACKPLMIHRSEKIAPSFGQQNYIIRYLPHYFDISHIKSRNDTVIFEGGSIEEFDNGEVRINTVGHSGKMIFINKKNNKTTKTLLFQYPCPSSSNQFATNIFYTNPTLLYAKSRRKLIYGNTLQYLKHWNKAKT
jgi:hypothetical protein